MADPSKSFSESDITDADRIGYIQEVLGELRTVSRTIRGNDVLTYFLEMATMEASDKAREIMRSK